MNATDGPRRVTSSTGDIDADGQIVGRSLREKQEPEFVDALVARLRRRIFLDVLARAEA